ncbi:MAG: DNA-processing protein DprA [Spirochaetaceae bacterium]|jgi:DNA processing protein|nr:DNA-processing protein DprA [Spirochaetaceae bacterium]
MDKEIQHQCEIHGVNWTGIDDSSYPPLLRELHDPPEVLYYRGVLPDPEKALVAIVGTRKPSPEAANEAYKLGLQFGQANIVLVSGLALGIDALAHRGNLDGGGKTIAVLGSGLANIYPASNRALARRIVNEGGCMVSEYPPMTPPAKWTFPARNRIIAGLARSVIVEEAPAKSGALITADFALELGRDIWVGSQGLSERWGAGTAKLVEDGARTITCAQDIVEDWYGN